MTRKTIEIVVATIAVVLLLMSLQAWHVERRKEGQLKVALEAQQKLISQTDGREAERQQSLKSALSEIAKLKASTRTPAQVLKELPKYLSLPKPIVDNRPLKEQVNEEIAPKPNKQLTDSPDAGVAGPDSTAPRQASNSDAPTQSTKKSGIEIPEQDLHQLFNFVQDCRVCDAKLDAAQSDAADQSAKITALARQRDLALDSAKGGTVWCRLRSHLRWLAAGAALGFFAAYRKG